MPRYILIQKRFNRRRSGRQPVRNGQENSHSQDLQHVAVNISQPDEVVEAP